MPDSIRLDSGNESQTSENTSSAGGDVKQAGSEEKPQEFTIKVGGEERTVTLEEMQKLASESAGAQSKFEEAANMRKEAASGIRVQELMGSIHNTPDGQNINPAEVNELASLLKLDPRELMDEINNEGIPAPSAKETSSKEKSPVLDKDTIKAVLGEILGMAPEELSGTVKRSFDRQVEDARKEIRQKTDNSVEKDEVLGKMMIGETKEGRAEVFKEMVYEDVLGKVRDGEPFGADLISSSIQKIRARFTKFGIPNESYRDPITLGLGPNSGLPANVTSEKPIERVPASDDSYIQNVVARMLQKQYRS